MNMPQGLNPVIFSLIVVCGWFNVFNT